MMLVLSRRIGERVVIQSDIYVTVVAVEGRRVVLGIDAPGAVPILRSELTEKRPAEKRSRIRKLTRIALFR
jgi:carbon storage regulator